MRKTHLFISTILLAFAFVLISCPNGTGNNVETNPENTENHTVYIASTNLSDYMQASLKAAGLEETNDAKTVPDVFVFRADDTLSEADLVLAMETCFAGKTLMVDSVSAESFFSFSDQLDTFLSKDENEYYSDMCDVYPYSIKNIFSAELKDALSDVESELQDDIIYESIAMRKNQIYYVHDLDEVFSDYYADEVKDADAKSVTNEDPSASATNSDDFTEVKDTVTSTQKEPGAALLKEDLDRVTADSLADFGNWIKYTGNTAARSAIDDAKTAQTFVHNFNAKFSSTSDHYDGRYNGRVENVQVTTSVWTACDIDKKKDYYLVKTSAVCHNEQLNYKVEWDDKYVSPWMDYCELTTSLGDGYASLAQSDCKPQTTQGSTSFSISQGFSLSGNVGFNSNGPTGGVGVGYSYSESTSRSIPDISVNLTVDANGKNAKWKFAGPDIKAEWSGLVTKCDGAKPIQTNTAIFDTLALYKMDSWNYWKEEKVPVSSRCEVHLKMLTAWLTNLGLTLNWKKPGYLTWHNYTDYVKKPSNTYCNYIMYFDAPENSTPERIDLYNKILKEYITDWNSSVRYYGLRDTAKSADYSRVNEIARKHFSSTEKYINSNKDVLKARGFSGKFTFKIKNDDTNTELKTFEVTF